MKTEIEIYDIAALPKVDQQMIKKGLCPWCLEKLTDGSLLDGFEGDVCFKCNDEFTGKLTIKD